MSRAGAKESDRANRLSLDAILKAPAQPSEASQGRTSRASSRRGPQGARDSDLNLVTGLSLPIAEESRCVGLSCVLGARPR